MSNTTTKRKMNNQLHGKRVKENYTVTTYIGSNDVVYVNLIDNVTGEVFRDLMLDFRFNIVFDNRVMEKILNVQDF